MNYGICNLSIIPAYAKPSHKSEMTTQILFGEHFEILDNQGNWLLVRLAYDNYECWIDSKQSLTISKKTFNQLNASPIACFTDLIRFVVSKKDGTILPIVLGSSLPFFSGNDCEVGDNKYTFYEKPGNGGGKKINQLISEYANKYLNAPYLWGGRTLFGIDCSGFTQIVFKLCGIRLPRDTNQQAEIGKTISLVEETVEGDLAFFENEEKKISHAGIILSNNEIIHASGKVRIDKIDQKGIYNLDTKEYSHTLKLLKRVI